jgi:hypothetical protein
MDRREPARISEGNVRLWGRLAGDGSVTREIAGAQLIGKRELAIDDLDAGAEGRAAGCAADGEEELTA